MDDAKLTERGWESQEIEPGNCVEEKWRLDGAGIEGVITKNKDGSVEGLIKAVEDAADAKRKGEMLLRELNSTEEAADTIEKLMEVLETHPPHKETDETPQPRMASEA